MYIELYKKWNEAGELPYNTGICHCLFMAGIGFEYANYIDAGAYAEWDHWNEVQKGVFDGVRQNMILLLAAMNDEL